MKLKSKLIATIVSICAAIAVMGVGVWAATSSFTVTVTNNVNVEFTKLTGSVAINATAETSTTDESAYATAKLIATPNTAITSLTGNIYEYGVQEKNYTIQSETGTDNTTTKYQQWDGTNLFTNAYINETIAYAKLSYTFTYTPVSGATATGYTTVVVTPTEPTGDVKGATMAYSYSVKVKDGTEQKDVTGKTFYAADDKVIIVTITATYANPSKAAVKLGSDTAEWAFTVAYANVLTAPTGTGATALS